MTNEKAIEILQNMAPGCGEKVRYPESVNCEAIDIAINALSSYKNEPLTLEKLREKWEPCELCKSCTNCWFCMNIKTGKPCVDCDKYSKFSPVSYCRYCGRPLTKDAWAGLEKRIRR